MNDDFAQHYQIPALPQMLMHWILVTAALLAYAFGGDALQAMGVWLAYFNLSLLGVCLERLQELNDTRARIDALRTKPRCGTIWTRKGPIL